MPEGSGWPKRLTSWFILILWLSLLLFPWHLFIESKIDLTQMLAPPSWQHPLGTSHLGRDVLLDFIDALRGSVLPLWGSVVMTSILGYLVGFGVLIWAENRRWGGVVKNILRLSAVLFLSIPISIIVFLVAHFLERAGLKAVILSLSVFCFLRSLQSIFEFYDQGKTLAYWQAHCSLGGHLWQRLWYYGFMRDWRGALVNQLAFHLSISVCIEAALSYLGFGVQPPAMSFGNILSAHYDQFLKGHWSVMLIASAWLLLTYMVPQAVVHIISLVVGRGAQEKSGETS